MLLLHTSIKTRRPS